MNDFLEVVDWSRAQFALTAMYHWCFVPLTLGLSFLIAFMETQYVRTGDEFYKRTTKFWMKLFGVNFAIGVATGIILEFEFGTNWSNYSYFVGDIFGAPLAIEGIFAFFMESTFIAVMFFGWNRVSKRFHLTATWLTAFGASLSALWILVANAWMQYPVGMEFNPATARNEMVDFWEILSPVAMTKFFHTVTSGFLLAAVFVVGISAWFLLKGREIRMARFSIKLASIFGLISGLLVIWTGDLSGKQVAKIQPMKMAAMEALYEGSENAALSLIPGLEVPGVLSVLAHGDSEEYVIGINDLTQGNSERGVLSFEQKKGLGLEARGAFAQYKAAQKAGDVRVVDSLTAVFQNPSFKDDKMRYFGYAYLDNAQQTVPNVGLVYWAFRVMVYLGCWFMVLFGTWLVITRKKMIAPQKWWLRLSLWSIALVYLSSQAGWVVAEVGRQPWVIQDMMPTVAAISSIEVGAVQATFWIFAALFTVLMIAEVTILVKQIKKGPQGEEI